MSLLSGEQSTILIVRWLQGVLTMPQHRGDVYTSKLTILFLYIDFLRKGGRDTIDTCREVAYAYTVASSCVTLLQPQTHT